MDGSLRTDMERRLGHDFSGVRVHADPEAGASARAVRAAAYTVGNHVVFAPGRFAPGTPAGRRLVTHELAHVVQHARRPARPGESIPLFRQPQEEDPVEVRRRAALDAFAGLAETVPPVFGDDPQMLISWATGAAARLEKSVGRTRPVSIYTARGLLRAYTELKKLERRAARAADGALMYHDPLADNRELPWGDGRPRAVEEIPSFTTASVAEWRALASLDPDGGAAPRVAAAVRGRPGATAPAAPASVRRRSAPVKLARTLTFTKPAGLDINTEEGQLKVTSRIIRAMYPQMDDLLLNWVVTKLGTTLPDRTSRFTDAWRKSFQETAEGKPISLTADEALTFEVDALLLHAPDRVGLIGADVFRSSYGMYYILAIEFAVALAAFAGGAAIGAAAADVGATSGLVRAGVGQLVRTAAPRAPAAVAAVSALAGTANVVQDMRTQGLHAYQLGDIAGVIHDAMEGRMMWSGGGGPDIPSEEGPGSSTIAPATRRAAPIVPDIVVEAGAQLDPSKGRLRASIRDAATGMTFDGEIDPVTRTGQIIDRKTGAVVRLIRDGRNYLPDTPPSEAAPAPTPIQAPAGGPAPASRAQSRTPAVNDNLIPLRSSRVETGEDAVDTYRGGRRPPKAASARPFYAKDPRSGRPSGSEPRPSPMRRTDEIANRGYPLGFKSRGQFNQFGEAARGALRQSGYNDAQIGLQGSAVTGRSASDSSPFDSGRVSDFDVAVVSPTLFAEAKAQGIPVRASGAMPHTEDHTTFALTPDQAAALGVGDLALAKTWRQEDGRAVNVMVFASHAAAIAKQPNTIWARGGAGH